MGDVPGSTLAAGAAIWDGHSWNPNPPPGTGSFFGLNSLSCPTPTSCAAIGSEVNYPGMAQGNYSSPIHQGLIESWNGSTWQINPRRGT